MTMADEQQVVEQPPPPEIIAPGYTFGTVTDQIATVVLTKQHAAVLVRRRSASASALLLLFLLAVALLFAKGVGHLGHPHAGDVGIRHHQFRVVDRNRPRRHADLRHSAAAQPALAQLHQPFRRSHDAVRGGLRRHVPAAAPGPSLAVLLAVSLSQHHGRAAAISAARWCGTCSRSPLTPRSRCCSGTSA